LKKYLKSKTGFSFLEVLAALVILSAALIPIMLWVPTSIQTKLKTERKTTAIFLSQSKIEELRYKIIKNFSADYNQASTPFGSPYQDFRYSVTDDLNPNLKTISVQIWQMETPGNETIFYTQVAKR
jgi:prepilin-type N-terminal cleavage/methylation domain-containing protein